MKKTLVLSANAVPKRGGQGLNLHHMTEALRDLFNVEVFCPSPCPGLPSTRVPRSWVGRAFAQTPVLRRFRDWTVAFEDRHFDHYVAARLPRAHFFQGVTGQCNESLKTAKAQGCFSILDVITTHMADFHEHQRRECARFGIRPPSNGVTLKVAFEEYARADLIRVMSEHAKNTFLERGFSSDRIAVIPPPLDLDEFPQADFREPKFRVSFVGLIEPWKGFHHLVEAFNAASLKDSELVLWGGPGARSIHRYLQQHMARNRAIVVNPVEVRSFGYGNVYAKSSVLVHPSLCDGFGYVVAEAMASGIPVITTKNTGAAQFVVDGENGYIVDPTDRSMLVDRLTYLAKNPTLVKEMGQAARRTAQGMTFTKMRQLYRTCLEPVCDTLLKV